MHPSYSLNNSMFFSESRDLTCFPKENLGLKDFNAEKQSSEYDLLNSIFLNSFSPDLYFSYPVEGNESESNDDQSFDYLKSVTDSKTSDFNLQNERAKDKKLNKEFTVRSNSQITVPSSPKSSLSGTNQISQANESGIWNTALTPQTQKSDFQVMKDDRPKRKLKRFYI